MHGGHGNRYRWWYKKTGIPGWQRFGYDPRFYPPEREIDYPPEDLPSIIPPPPEPTPIYYPPRRPMPAQPYQRWTVEDELRMLEEEQNMLEDELEEIKKRIEQLKNQKEVK